MMELRQSVTSDGTVTLTCTCGSEAFRVRFKKSASCLTYEQIRGDQNGKPDLLVTECVGCGSEITITSTEAQMPPPMSQTARNAADAMRNFNTAAGMPPEYYRYADVEEGAPPRATAQEDKMSFGDYIQQQDEQIARTIIYDLPNGWKAKEPGTYNIRVNNVRTGPDGVIHIEGEDI
jgi:hypothetical protein